MEVELSAAGARRAAYDVKKLRGKKIVRRIGRTRRYDTIRTATRGVFHELGLVA